MSAAVLSPPVCRLSQQFTRDVMRDSMIVNMSGRNGHSIGRDMNIEHGNNYQKVRMSSHLSAYKGPKFEQLKQHFFAKGMHAKFEVLGDLSPCMPIYTELRHRFSEFVGASWQGTSHKKPTVEGHIRSIRSKLSELDLLSNKPGCEVECQTLDIQSRGQEVLMDRGIKRFTEQYIALVRRGEEFEEDEDEIPGNPIILINEDELEEDE